MFDATKITVRPWSGCCFGSVGIGQVLGEPKPQGSGSTGSLSIRAIAGWIV